MHEILYGTLVFALYVLPAACIILTNRKYLKTPDELFQKTMLFILLGAYFVFLFALDIWRLSAGFSRVVLTGLCWIADRRGVSHLLRCPDDFGSKEIR